MICYCKIIKINGLMTAFSVKILSLSGEMVFLRILFDITKKIWNWRLLIF